MIESIASSGSQPPERHPQRTIVARCAVLGVALTLTACNLGPYYKRPDIAPPAAWTPQSPESGSSAPTPAPGDNSTNLATTAFVRAGFAPATGGSYVAKAGDTMTGNLVIANPGVNSAIYLNKAASGDGSIIQGQTGGLARWMLVLGDSAAETGSNAGSNFAIYSYGDNGSGLTTPFSILRTNGQATFNSPAVYITAPAGNYADLRLNKPASGQSNRVIGYTNGSPRWIMNFGNTNGETGSNAGSDFSLDRWSDAGSYIDTPLVFTRANGYDRTARMTATPLDKLMGNPEWTKKYMFGDPAAVAQFEPTGPAESRTRWLNAGRGEAQCVPLRRRRLTWMFFSRVKRSSSSMHSSRPMPDCL